MRVCLQRLTTGLIFTCTHGQIGAKCFVQFAFELARRKGFKLSQVKAADHPHPMVWQSPYAATNGVPPAAVSVFAATALSVCLSVCLAGCLSGCLSVLLAGWLASFRLASCVSVCLCVCVSVCLCVCVSV